MLTAADAGLFSIDTGDHSVYVADQPKARFQRPTRLGIEANPVSALSRLRIEADLNFDGIPDLIELDVDTVHVSLGVHSSDRFFFSPLQTIQVPGANGIVLKDVDGDGIPDLIISRAGRAALIEYGQGDGTFSPTRIASSSQSDSNLLIDTAAVGIAPRMTDMITAIPTFDVKASKKSFLILVTQTEASGENQAGTAPIAASSVKRDPIEVKAPDALIAGFLGVPSSLAFDLLSGDLLQSYSGASGIETASLLSFDFGNQDGPVTSTLPPAAPPVARLLPLGGTSLAMISTLRSEAFEGRTEARGDPATPSQDLSLGRPEYHPRSGMSPATDAVSRNRASSGVPRATRLLVGLDESFDRLSREAHRWGEPPVGPEEGTARSGTRDSTVESWPSALNLVVPAANVLILDRIRPCHRSSPRFPDPGRHRHNRS
jgi:hypothetical protein